MPFGFIAAGLGAIGSVANGIIGSNAASTASGQETAALQQALQSVQGMFGTTQQNFAPYQTAGTNALGNLQALLGLTPGGQSQAAALAATPGYQFELGQGTSAINNAASSQGLAQSGNTLRALQQFGQGLAGTTYQNQVNNLAGLTGTGLNATGALGQLSGNNSSLVANLLATIGGVQGAGTVGSANALEGGITGVSNALGSANLNSLSNAGSLWSNSNSLFGGAGPLFNSNYGQVLGNTIMSAYG